MLARAQILRAPSIGDEIQGEDQCNDFPMAMEEGNA
jgi:hypothetical protein